MMADQKKIIAILLIVALIFQGTLPQFTGKVMEARAEQLTEQETPLVRAIHWLQSQQGEIGKWGNDGLPNLTCNALAVLRKAGAEADDKYLSIWEKEHSALNVDEQAHLVWGHGDKEKLEDLLKCANPDGGYGLDSTYTSEIYDTLMVLMAAVSLEETEKEDYGTTIILHLKDDIEDEKYTDFLGEYRIKGLVKKYSDYIRYPIKMDIEHQHKKEGTEKQLEDILQNEDLLKNAVMTVETIPDIEDYVVTLLQKAIDLRNTISGRRYSDIILTAQKLIREEYMSEEISLNVVAARVCMSPSYFSTIFSKETGKTFIEYLTEVRMEKAKEYLVCTNRKTSDIAFEIGYKDPHYFSFLFKKTQGCTPKEYRTSRKEW